MKLTELLKKSDGQYQIMIVPANSARMKSFRLKHNNVRMAIFASLFLVFLISLTITLLAIQPFADEKGNSLIRENIELRNQLASLQTKLALLDNTMERLEKFDRKLRVMTNFVDHRRKAAMGPLSESEMIAGQMDGKLHTNEGLALLLQKKLGELESADLTKEIDRLIDTALEREKELAELGNFLEDQRLLLSHTPSIWPSEGWLTSTFGNRKSPFTNTQIFHEGIDIANNIGTPVHAPADGTVIFTGNRDGYGMTVVINHGFGLTTRYGHLSEFEVKIGDRITRGDLIAKVGNTGRSTGPHLHYEVRVNNIPQNPRRYILD